jgi:hypothetical protein
MSAGLRTAMVGACGMRDAISIAPVSRSWDVIGR